MIPNKMIDVREAAKIAVEYCGQIFPAMARVRLEEVELTTYPNKGVARYDTGG